MKHTLPKPNQTGFTLVETLLVIIALAIVSFVGYYIYHTQKSANSTLSSASSVAQSSPAKGSVKKTSTATTTTQAEKQTLANGAVSYMLPVGWEEAPQVSGSSDCVTSVESTAECLDEATLVLKSEGYTNSDQFQASVSVYKNTNGESPTNWFTQVLHDGGDTGSTTANLTINSHPAIKYSVPQGNEEVDLSYVITSNNYAVVVFSDLFSGTHYSYTTTNNYLGYSSTIDSLAKSLTFSN